MNRQTVTIPSIELTPLQTGWLNHNVADFPAADFQVAGQAAPGAQADLEVPEVPAVGEVPVDLEGQTA